MNPFNYKIRYSSLPQAARLLASLNIIVPSHSLASGGKIMGKGGSITIKPENRGKFTKWAAAHGMGVQEAASHVMANKGKYDNSVVKMANFAKNSTKFKHNEGGVITGNPLKRFQMGGPINLIPGTGGMPLTGGGGTPGQETGPGRHKPQRKLKPEEVLAYREHMRGKNIQHLADVDESDPYFQDKAAFVDFYRQKALGKMKPDDRSLYDQTLKESGQQGADAIVAMRGGTPDFETYMRMMRQQQPKPVKPRSEMSVPLPTGKRFKLNYSGETGQVEER